MKLVAPDGKKRETDCADTEGLLRIIQSIPSPKAEPFKRWLAKVGSERMDEIQNPELVARRRDARGFSPNKTAAVEGGTVAGNARKDLEKKAKHLVSSKENFKALAEKAQRQIK